MQAFVSYRQTGGDEDDIRQMLTTVCGALRDQEIEPFCTFFDAKLEPKYPRPKPRKFMDEAFRMIGDSDFLLVIQSSEARSEGMLMEVGYCLAKGIPVIVATHESVKHTYLPDMADVALVWNDYDDLTVVIKGGGLQSLHAQIVDGGRA